MSRLMPCRAGGCPENVDGGGYCPTHRSNNDRANDPTNELYKSKAWRSVSTAIRVRNPMCQMLHPERGKLMPCHNPSTLVHHRWSPRERPDLFMRTYDESGVSHLIALCADCHPTSDGTPEWQEAKPGSRVPFGAGKTKYFGRTVGIEYHF